jgi:predicted nucleotidyltransferase
MDDRGAVAREAAKLLYFGYASEYKQAKERAAENLGLTVLPSNYEVALELDQLVKEIEGEEREKLLKMMRITALNVMRAIKEYDPCLVGSVWRGTVKRKSDIDITLYTKDWNMVEEILSKKFQILGTEETKYLLRSQPRTSHHIRLKVSGFDVEVVVRRPEDREKEYCEIYGDIKSGLRVEELEEIMEKDPLRRFVPQRRRRK